MKAYKFRPNFSENKYKSLLTDAIIWFAAPESFNDPFDCRIPVRDDLENKENRRKELKKLFTQNEPNSNVDQINNQVEIVVHKYSNKQSYEQSLEDKDDLINQRIGIFSLAGDYRNILLWGHYADGHRGFCIEYDLDILKEYFKGQHREKQISVIYYPVEYHSNLPVVIRSQLIEDELFTKQFTTKYKDWRYEKEHRFFANNSPNTSWPIPFEAISSVFLGCMMDDTSIESIRESMSKMPHKPNLIKAVRSLYSYELQFEGLEY